MMNSNQAVFPTVPNHTHGMKTLTMEQVDPSTLEDDSDSDAESQTIGVTKPGKKTKGRVKIKMEFIENKLRRYTTFSKRKTGIMKKAYELSTLTGTQVMLLVASETGHVYTFATRKLQPMITSESGKALIQTCLNSPDPPPGTNPHYGSEQRMNPTGFEETELSYAVGEEEGMTKMGEDTLKPQHIVKNLHTSDSPVHHHHPQHNMASLNSVAQPASVVPQTTTTSMTNNGISMITGIPPGAVIVPQGASIIPVQNGQQVNTASANPQTMYRIQNTNQVVSIPNNQLDKTQDPGHTITAGHTPLNSVTATSQSSNGGSMTQGVVMFQTPQGIVYAPTTANLQDRSVFSLSQPTNTLTNPSAAGEGQQQIIIPVSVSLAGSHPQVLQFSSPSSATENTSIVSTSQHSMAKKSRKG